MQLYNSENYENISTFTQSLQTTGKLEPCSFSGNTIQSTGWDSVICAKIFSETPN